MKVPRAQVAEAIAKKTLTEHDPAVLAREIAAYLLTENRVQDLDSLMRDVMAYRQEHGVVEATVMSAHDLTADVKSEVAGLVQDHYPAAKMVIIRETHDPEVIGGLKVKLANEQLDLSVRARLDTFKRLTLEGTK